MLNLFSRAFKVTITSEEVAGDSIFESADLEQMK